MGKLKDNSHLLLEFSTEDNHLIETAAKNLLHSNTQYQEKYFVDGIGYFVLTNYKNRNFCHIDVYLIMNEIEFMPLKEFLKKALYDLKQNLNLERSKNKLLLFKFFDGEYSRLELENNSISLHENKKNIKMYAITYSIGIDTVKNSHSDIINLGFWLANALRDIFNETKKINLNTSEFLLYFYNLIISKLSFLVEYYKELISKMNNSEFYRDIYYSSYNEIEKIDENPF